MLNAGTPHIIINYLCRNLDDVGSTGALIGSMVKYKSDLSAGSLLVSESKVIAALMRQGMGADRITERVVAENLLQKRSVQYTQKLTGAILDRLGRGDEVTLGLVAGDRQVAAQTLLALNLMRSHLLLDFMALSLADEYRLGHDKLENTVWNRFVEGCISRDPEVQAWSTATLESMRKVVFRMLVEAGYLESTRSRRLQKVFIQPEVSEYLTTKQLEPVLQAMKVSYV